MELVAISVLIWAGKGILNRAGEDLLDNAYANLKAAGRPLLGRLMAGLRSNDQAEVEAAAVAYANHLRENPEEAAVVLDAAVKTLSAEPVELYDALVKVMADTVGNLETRPRGVKAGCAAFVGSFPNPDWVTVLDVRHWDMKRMQQLLGQRDFAGKPGVWFGYSNASSPRMWILEVPPELSAADLAANLNSHLLDKHDNPDDFGPLDLDSQLANEQGEARVWSVSSILEDRVEIYYPGQVEELYAKQDLPILDRLQATELDKRRDAEKRLFDIADVAGPEALLASVVALRDNDTKSEQAWQAALARLAEEIGKAMGHDAA